MFISNCLLLTAAALGAHGLRTRQADSTFELYAYGSDMGGLPVFYEDGMCINWKAIAISREESLT